MPRKRPMAALVIVAFSVPFLCPIPAPATDNYYMPDAGGNWDVPVNWSLGHCPTSVNDAFIQVSGNAHKAVYYDAGSAGIGNLTIDGSAAGFYGALWQLQDTLMTEDVFIGDLGEATHWIEGNALLWSLGTVYVGYQDPGLGHFHLAGVDYGLLVNDDTYVGYHGAGDFDHLNGYHLCNHLFVGQNAPGTYWLKGPEATSTLEPEYYIVVGNADVGLFEQTGGTVVNNGNAYLLLGVNTGGEGTYLMKGGALNTDQISIGFNGEGYFEQSGGTVNVATSVNIGAAGSHTEWAHYELTEIDGAAELYIGGDLNVGESSLGTFAQYAGTATVTGNLEIWQGTTDPYFTSGVQMFSNSGTLEVDGETINHSGQFLQLGGVFTTPSFTSDSSLGVHLYGDADFRATTLNNNLGQFKMLDDALVRGEYAGGGLYYMCNLTNEGIVLMGTEAVGGGTFVGHMTNNNLFNYWQGDFSESTLTNNGTLDLHAPFTCKRFVQNVEGFVVSPDASITATGTGYANAFENNAHLTIENGATITVVNAPLVNNNVMNAGGTVEGDVENDYYIMPSADASTDRFQINGDYTSSPAAILRIRLGGPNTGEYDQLAVQGAAQLAGRLDLRLIDGFTPRIGDSFLIVTHASRSGEFDTETLPTLPVGRRWSTQYAHAGVSLVVVAAAPCAGDVNNDGSVNISDLGIVLANFGTTGATREQGDLSGDGQVNITDLGEVLANFGQACW